MKITVKATILLIVMALLVACEQTRTEVVEQYKEPFAEKRKQLIIIAESLPPVGNVLENSYCKNMDPALILKDGFSGNEVMSSMLMYDQLLDPDIDYREKKRLFDVSMNSGPLILGIRWTGPQNPMVDSAMKEYDNKFAKKLETALATPYLVVNRIANYTPAQIITKNSFLPGQVIIEGFVIALKDNQILCSYRVDIKTSVETIYYRTTDDPLDQAFAPSDALQGVLEKDTRLAIQNTLIEITGGTIKYNELSLPQAEDESP